MPFFWYDVTIKYRTAKEPDKTIQLFVPAKGWKEAEQAAEYLLEHCESRFVMVSIEAVKRESK